MLSSIKGFQKGYNRADGKGGHFNKSVEGSTWNETSLQTIMRYPIRTYLTFSQLANDIVNSDGLAIDENGCPLPKHIVQQRVAMCFSPSNIHNFGNMIHKRSTNRQQGKKALASGDYSDCEVCYTGEDYYPNGVKHILIQSLENHAILNGAKNKKNPVKFLADFFKMPKPAKHLIEVLINPGSYPYIAWFRTSTLKEAYQKIANYLDDVHGALIWEYKNDKRIFKGIKSIQELQKISA